MRPPLAAGDPHLHSARVWLPPSLPPAAERVSGQPLRSARVRSELRCRPRASQPRTRPGGRGAGRQFPAGNRPPSPPAPARAGSGKGWGPAWMAWTRGSQCARVGRQGWQWRVDGGGGGKSEKSLPGVDCLVPPGWAPAGRRCSRGASSPGRGGRPRQARSPGGSRGDPRPGGEPRL